MRAKAVRGALCFAILFVMGVIGLGAIRRRGADARLRRKSFRSRLRRAAPTTLSRTRKNIWTVGVAGGLMSGTNMTFADEMAQVLDDSDNLRVLPIVTYGAASNLDDLLYLRGVDVAITQSDVFEYFRTQRKTANLEGRIHYILRLPISEMHVLAGNDIKSIEDLRGKKVNFGPAGSASSLTGSIVFQRYGIKVEPTNYDNPVAMQKLKAGEIAALIRVIGKPVELRSRRFRQVRGCTSCRCRSPRLSRIITRSANSPARNIRAWCRPARRSIRSPCRRCSPCSIGQRTTIATGGCSASSRRSTPSGTNSCEPPRHPKWKDVNLAATVPGWTRWSVAEDMLRKVRQDAVAEAPPASGEFTAFLKNQDRRRRYTGAARGAVPRVPAVAAAPARAASGPAALNRRPRGKRAIPPN